MKLAEVYVCVGLALLAARTHAGIVPLKASLSLKDKLALDIPLKQLITDKTGEKSQTVKVAFPTTTTPATTATTLTTTTPPKQQRPNYVDAAIFRHQFTTPATSTTSFPIFEIPSDVPFRGDFLPKKDSSSVVESIAERLTSGTTTTSPRTTTSPSEEYPVFDYEAHFRFMDDLSSFQGELGVSGDDRRGEGYISSFRPLGF